MVNKWLVIINPASGCGKGKKDWQKISDLLKNTGIHFEPVFTKYRCHATELATEAIEKGWRHIISVGGDGTINEVVNGIFAQDYVPTTEVTLAMIPTGEGKDLGRTIGIPSDYRDAINTIKNGATFVQDAGLVRYYDGNTQKKRYFVNIAGMGYDAFVAKRTNYMKEHGHDGVVPYLSSLFMCLLRYKYTNVKFKIDELELKDTIFSLNVGICKYNGGGMMQVPEAIPDDGLLDVTVIKKIGKLEVIKNVKNLYDGSFVRHPMVQTFRGKTISIESEPEIYLEVDGESLGHSPFHFGIIARSVKIVVAK
ncbi:MAG: diacylglycerol kinase family lipid kinase [bacterium]|nr:diacylglycerol kinase family lipid kinase [bacterium]